MENVIEVNTGSLAQDVQDMKEVLSELKKEMDEMDTLIASLNMMWQGDAKDAFTKQYNTDRQVWLDMRVNMEEILKGMQNARLAYEKCESSVGQKIDSLRI